MAHRSEKNPNQPDPNPKENEGTTQSLSALSIAGQLTSAGIIYSSKDPDLNKATKMIVESPPKIKVKYWLNKWNSFKSRNLWRINCEIRIGGNMNFINRALKKTSRNITKTVLLILTFCLVGNFVIVGLGIEKLLNKQKLP